MLRERCSPGAIDASVSVSTTSPSTVRRTGTALAAALPVLVTSTW
jgi:hypothetical protein